jgi:hypothetical protein
MLQSKAVTLCQPNTVVTKKRHGKFKLLTVPSDVTGTQLLWCAHSFCSTALWTCSASNLHSRTIGPPLAFNSVNLVPHIAYCISHWLVLDLPIKWTSHTTHGTAAGAHNQQQSPKPHRTPSAACHCPGSTPVQGTPPRNLVQDSSSIHSYARSLVHSELSWWGLHSSLHYKSHVRTVAVTTALDHQINLVQEVPRVTDLHSPPLQCRGLLQISEQAQSMQRGPLTLADST